MTHEEIIEELQDAIQHNRIDDVELDRACCEHRLDLFDDLLSPIGYSLCDRCGDYGDSELDFFWLDGFDWDEDDPRDKAILKALNEEKQDYCALCWDCVKELEKKGKE